MHAKDLLTLLKETWTEFNADKAPRLGAALAYYTIFSLAPLLVLAVVVAGAVFGQSTARAELVSQTGAIAGPQAAEVVKGLIDNAAQPGSGILATVISLVTLLFGASGVFGELQAALNTVWGVEPRSDLGWKGMLRNRLTAFALVIATGLLLLISIVVSSVISALTRQMTDLLPGSDFVWRIANLGISLLMTTLLFAAIFKLVPDVEVAWRDVFVGALVTAILFSIGRTLLGYYLGGSATTSVYGAAGSLAVVLLWIYYSTQIFFLGAEFTQVYANTYGGTIRPSRRAVAVVKSTGSTPATHN